MTIITMIVKPKFKETFKLKEIEKGFFFADFLKDELRSGAKGINLENKEVELLHDNVQILSKHKDQMSVFGFNDLQELNYKELHKSNITMDFKNGIMTNEVFFLTQNNELEKAILETQI